MEARQSELHQTFQQIEQNDPRFTELYLSKNIGSGRGRCLPQNPQEWERCGNLLGTNDHVLSLHFPELSTADLSPENMEAFSKGFNANRSIRILTFVACDIGVGTIFQSCLPFFEKNSNLTQLVLDDVRLKPKGVRMLSQAIRSGTPSLTRISLWCMDVGDETLGNLLSSLDKTPHSPHSPHSPHLEHLSIRGRTFGKKSFTALGKLFRTPKFELKQLEILECTVDDDAIIGLFSGFGKRSQLNQLSLVRTSLAYISRSGWKSFCKILQSPLEELHLEQNSIGTHGMIALASQMAKSTSLRTLRISAESSIAFSGWETLGNALQSTDLKLEKLILMRNNIGNHGIMALSNGVGNNSSLRELHIMYNTVMMASGLAALGAALNSPRSQMKELSLVGNGICDLGVSALANQLANNRKLTSLHLCCNHAISVEGWANFSQVLRNPHTNLENIYLRMNRITDEGATALWNGMAHNRSVHTLDLGNNHITETGWNGLLPILCDDSTIDSTFFSNHILSSVTFQNETDVLPPDVEFYLRMNRISDKTSVAMQKILEHHLCGEFDVGPFKSSLKLLPLVLARINCAVNDGMSRDHNTRLAALFPLVKSVPFLFDSK